jgi:hypothetical protein
MVASWWTISPGKNFDALDEHCALAQSARQEWRVVLVTVRRNRPKGINARGHEAPIQSIDSVIVMFNVWLMTGSSRGLGRAFTEVVPETGQRLVRSARQPEELSDVHATPMSTMACRKR